VAKHLLTAGIPPLAAITKAALDKLAVKGTDPGATRTLRRRTVTRGRFSQMNYICDLPLQPVMEDEPEGLLGEAIAPNASEALLAAFGSRLAVGIHANAAAQGIPVRSLELELAADLNTTAVWEAGDLYPKAIGSESVRVLVSLDAPRTALEALIGHTTLWPLVANTLHNTVFLDEALWIDPAGADA